MRQMPPPIQQEASKLDEKAKREKSEDRETLKKNPIGNQECGTGIEEKRADMRESESGEESEYVQESESSDEEKSYVDMKDGKTDEEKESVDKNQDKIPDYQDSEGSTNIVPPSTMGSIATKGNFSPFYVSHLLSLFQSMISKTEPVSKSKIEKDLLNDACGKEMIKVVSLDQIVNRVKYERRKKGLLPKPYQQ